LLIRRQKFKQMLQGNTSEVVEHSLTFMDSLNEKSISPEKEQLLRNNASRKFITISGKVGV
jgi:hypothetical protein